MWKTESIVEPYGYFGHYAYWLGAPDYSMKSMSAKDAKNGFGLLLDTARAEPVTIEKHGRAVVVVVSIEEFERLRHLDSPRGRRKAVTEKD